MVVAGSKPMARCAGILLLFCLAAPSLNAQVLSYRDVAHGDDVAVQMAVRCSRPHLTASLAPGGVRVRMTGLGSPREFTITRVRDASPDDIALDLYFYLPNDLTMLDSYGDMMRLAAQIPAAMRTFGHRNHHYYYYTYSACADGTGRVVAAHHTLYNRPYYLARAAELGGLEEKLAEIPQDETCAFPRGRRFFRGVNVHDGLNALIDLLEEEGVSRGVQHRPRILLMVAEGRNTNVGPAGEVDLDRLEAVFDQVILFQPDIAPVQYAINQAKLGRIGGLNAAILRRYRIARKREKGCESWEGPARCIESIEQEVANVSAVLEDNPGIVSGAFGGRRFVSRVGLTRILATVTGREREAYVARLARDLDRAIPRPTGLDCLGLALRERGLGDQVVVGGRPGTVLTCPGAGQEPGTTTPGDSVRSMAEALMELSPFAQARVLEGCVRDGRLSPSVEIRDQVDVTVLVDWEEGVEAVCTRASFLPTSPDREAEGESRGETLEAGAPAPGTPPADTGGRTSRSGPRRAALEPTGANAVPDWARLVCEDQDTAPPAVRSAVGRGVPPVALLGGALIGFLVGWIFTSRRRA